MMFVLGVVFFNCVLIVLLFMGGFFFMFVIFRGEWFGMGWEVILGSVYVGLRWMEGIFGSSGGGRL